VNKAIDDLMHEHEAILSSLQILDAMVGRLGQKSPPSAEDLSGFIGFLKEFADKCHHGKEEGILEKGGPIGQMLAEHAEGRKLIKGMEAAISGAVDARAFTAAANGYATLLRAHIQKENTVLFPVGEKTLTAAQLDVIFDRFKEHEEKVIGHGRHEELHAMLKELKRKCAPSAS
jgi:hemerythrin-like domain-containing protein